MRLSSVAFLHSSVERADVLHFSAVFRAHELKLVVGAAFTVTSAVPRQIRKKLLFALKSRISYIGQSTG